MKKQKSILKGASTSEATEASSKSLESEPAPVQPPKAAAPVLTSSDDLTIEQVRSTLQLINKMLRKEAKQEELASLLKIKEVREILDLFKVNPKDASEKISQYQKDLAARLRAHDRGKRPAGELEASSATGSKKQRVPSDEVPPSKDGLVTNANAPINARKATTLTGILSQSELAMAPSGQAPSEFNVEWLQYFFQLMCSKVPFFSDKKYLAPCSSRTYVEESEDQRVFVDGLSSNEIILLLNFIYDLESNLISKKSSRVVIIPNKFVFIPVMGDPIESGLLESWYYANQSQCATCGLRYASRKILTEHHDYHYHKYTAAQRRKRGLENNFRGWMETPSEWLGSVGMEFVPSKFFEKIMITTGELIANNDQSSVAGTSPPVAASSEAAASGKSVVANHVAISHSAHTVTELQQIADDLLPNSIPVDEIKSVCFECGESFQKIWIGEPVDMAVYHGAVALPLGGGTPLSFSWPAVKLAGANEMGEIEPDSIQNQQGEEWTSTAAADYRVDAVSALFDQRFVNAIFVHKACLANDPEKLRSRQYQLQLLGVVQNPSQVIDWLEPPVDEPPTTTTLLEEIPEEEEDDNDVNMMVVA